jgi:hypothetical protein
MKQTTFVLVLMTLSFFAGLYVGAEKICTTSHKRNYYSSIIER